MDKLQKNIRRPNGDVVSLKRPHGPRLLLPTELELCNLLGISEDEYWIFVDQTAAYNGKRPEGYELIPDIRCDPITSVIFTQAFLIKVGIAVAAATISYLLTPKPKEQKSGGSRRTADAIGNTKFAPQASFNSVQELATLGDAIPLIFTNQYFDSSNNNYVYGGIRVNSQLLWSQFVSLGKYQQLKALALFSHGTIGNDPDYEGYAVGDTLLSTYNSHKVGLYFRDGSNTGNNRIIESDRYTRSELTFTDGNDPFVVGIPSNTGGSVPTTTSKSFSGARNPTTQTIFGAYSPVPNCQIVRLPYELIRDPRGSTKEAIKDMMRKRKKLEFAKWPTRAGILQINNTKSKGLHNVSKNDTIMYQVVGTQSGDGNAYQRVYSNSEGAEDKFNYRPHGVEDVDNLTMSIRENIDSLFAVGEQYLFGTALVVCTGNDNDPVPWTIEKTKEYTFKVIEPGQVDIPVNNANLTIHCQNPKWFDPGSSLDRTAAYSLSDQGPILWQQIISETERNYGRGQNDLYHGHDILTAQRVALATVSNNRICDVTEIGIKSTVYKRIRFANVASQPDEAALQRAFEDRTQIQLGQVNTYAKRISLFMLQARRIGDTTWYDLINTSVSNHSGLFAVRGNTPEAQYNAITISHPSRGQYEYRFKPYPGNYITRNNLFNKNFNLLGTDSSGDAAVYHFSGNTPFGTFDVAFSGSETYSITETEACNTEWQLGASSVSTAGSVTDARLSGQTSWSENHDFNGVDRSCGWQDHAIHKGHNQNYIIVLHNSVTSPEWAAGRRAAGQKDWVWTLYRPGGLANAISNDYFGNNTALWPTVEFWEEGPPEQKFWPADPSEHYHPSNNVNHFWVREQRWVCNETTRNTYTHFDGPVEVQGGSGTGLYVNLKVEKQDENEFSRVGQPVVYRYRASWSIDSSRIGSGYVNGEQVRIPWTKADGSSQNINVTLTVTNVNIITRSAQNFNSYDALIDWNVYEGDENSNRNDPDHEIVYVNEILQPANETQAPAKYSNLAFAGIRINSSKEWTNFSQFSAYFKKGIEIEKLNSSGKGASNLFPEIAYALLTDTKLGAGKLVGADSVDRGAMADAADFCHKNKFYWDGTISSKLNLRDFIFEHAAYCLLDFTIIGGKFSLKPSVPVNNNNEIDKRELPDIKCLFTDGNINDLQVSFLSPEERQTFRAAVLYRQEKSNGFPETKSILVSEAIANHDSDPIETFDLSGFCTSRQQALYFAFHSIRSRRLIDHGLTFKTAPQYVLGLGPGDYFRLVSEATHTSRFKNGAKLDNGTIVSKDSVSNSEQVYYWKPGTEGVQSGTLGSAPNGVLFTVKNTTTENKVYKCETITYGDDGLLEVSGSFTPTESNGQLSVMQDWGSSTGQPSNFYVIDS